MTLESNIANAFDALWAKSSERNWIYGRLGRPNGGSTLYDVPGQPGYKYVMKGSEGQEGLVTAIDRIGVAPVANQRVKMRREYGHLVIREAEQLAGGGGGGGSNTLAGLYDVTLSSLADGNMLQYDAGSSRWVNVIPAGGSGALGLNALTDVTLSSLANHNYLIYDSGSSQWINAVPSHGDLSGITSDQHHARVHDIISGDGSGAVHTIVGSALQIVGATATNTLGLLTPSSNPGAAAAILRTDNAGGITIGGGMFVVTPSTHQVTIDGTTVAVDTSLHQVTVGGATIFNNTTRFNAVPTFNADLAFVGADHTITSAAGLDVTWDLGGDLLLAAPKTFRSSDFLDDIPIAGYSLFVNSGGDRQLTINTIKSDSLHTRLFVADAVRIDIGEERWGKSMGIVHDDFVSPAAIGGTIVVTFEDSPLLGNAPLFSNNDFVLFRYLNDAANFAFGSIWGQVTGFASLGLDADGRGYQHWTFTLRHGDTTALVKKGNVAVDYGASGQGYAFLSVLSDANGPWFRIGRWTGSDPFTAGNTHVLTSMGNLNGLVGYSTNVYGFAAGNDLSLNPGSGGFSGMVAEATSGLVLYNTDLTLYQSGTKTVELTRAHGLSLRYDTALFNDPMRYIGWFDDLNTVTAQPNVGVAANTDVVGSQLWRRIALRSFATDGSETSIDIQSSGHSGSADMLLLSREANSDNTLASLISLNAAQTIVQQTLVVGGFAFGTVAKPFSASQFTVHQENNFIDYRAGMTILQDGVNGDAVLHWQRRAFSVGGVFVSEQWYSAGIDETDNNKFKISASQSLGGADFIIIDPSTGSVSIPGFNYGASPPPVAISAGPGITISGGSTISVDFGAVPHITTGIYTDSGSGLTGGGDLTADRHLQVLVPGTSGLQLTTAGIVVNDTLAGNGLTMAAGKIINVNAGPGIAIAADAVQIALASSSGLNTTSGLAVDATLAGAGLAFASGVLSVNSGPGISIVADAVQVALATPSALTTTGGLAVADALAGSGLTMAAKVLSVNVGPGISIVADAVQVALATPSGLTISGGLAVADALAGTGLTWLTPKVLGVDFSLVPHSTTQMIAGAGLTGGGDLSANRTFDVVAGDASLVVNANELHINQGFAFAWTGGASFSTGVYTFNTDPQIAANLDFIGTARNITSSAATNLNILPGGDLVLNPGGFDVFPGGSGIINLGGYNRKWSTLYASELYVETLVASSVMATVGGRVMITPTSSLINDFLIGATTIDLKHNSFVLNTWLYLENIASGIPQIEAIKVTSATPTTITGGFRYTVSRGSGLPYTTSPKNWVVGDAVVSLGAAINDGYIDQASIQTIHSKVGPTVTIYSRTATTNWNDTSPVVSMGNLNGFAGLGSVYGFAAGNNLTLSPSTGFSGFTADAVGGLKMYNTPIILYNGTHKVVSITKEDGVQFDNDTSVGTPAWLRWYADLDAVTSTNAIASITTGYAGVSGTATLNIRAGAGGTSGHNGQIQMSVDDSVNSYTSYLTMTDYRLVNTAGNVNFVVQYGGNVGISTASPSAKFDVAGTIRTTSAAGAPSTGAGVEFSYASSTGNVAAYDRGASAYKDLRLDGATLALQSASGSNVVMGRTTVLDGGSYVAGSDKIFEVANPTATASTTTLFSVLALTANKTAGSSHLGHLAFQNQALAGAEKRVALIAGLTGTTNDDGALLFFTALNGTISEAMRITEANVVGIGTATPTTPETFSRLTVQASDATAVYSSIINTGAGQTGLVINRTGGTASRWLAYIPAAADKLLIYSQTLTHDVMSFLASGNVGIGNPSPVVDLHLGTLVATNNVGLGGIMVGVNAAQTSITMRNSGGVETSLLNWTAQGYVGTMTNHPFIIRSNNADRITLTAAGLVGVNNAAPSAQMDVAGTIRTTSAAGAPTTGAGVELSYASSTGNVAAYDRGASAYKDLRLDGATLALQGNSGGNIAIGQTAITDNSGATISQGGTVMQVASPTSAGSGATQYSVVDMMANKTAGSGWLGMLTFSNKALAGAEKRAAIIGALTGTTNDDGTLVFYTALNAVISEVMRLTEFNTVGIGTASPSALLDVGGVIRTTGVTSAPTTGTGVQIYYNSASSFGSIAAYAAAGASYQDLRIDANPLKLNASNNAQVGVATALPVGQLGVEATNLSGISSSIYSANFNTFNSQAHFVSRSARGTKGGTLTGTLSGDSILALEGYGSNSANAWLTVPSFAMYARATESYNNGQTNGGATLEIYLRSNGTAGAPAAPVLKIDQNGNATLLRNLTVNTGGLANTGQIILTNAANSSNTATLAIDNATSAILKPSSSRRYKQDIRMMPAEFGPDFVMKLRPTMYRYKGLADRDLIGLIAEEVAEAGGEPFVGFDSEGRPDGLRYDLFVAPLIATAQQQQFRIIELERRLAELERKLAA